MTKTITIQLSVYLVLTVATVTLCRLFPNAATNPQAGLVMYLPDKFEGYVAVTRETSAAEKEILPPDTTILSKSYTGYSDDRSDYGFFSATLVLAGADKRSLHRPEICLTAQGWTIEKDKVVKIDLDSGELEVMHLSLTREQADKNGGLYNQRAHYLYWWVGKEKTTPYSNERALISASNNIFKNVNDRWGYPSVISYTNEGKENGNEIAIQRAHRFIKMAAPKFQKSLGAIDIEDALEIKELGEKVK